MTTVNPLKQCQETSAASAYTYNEYDINTDEDNTGLLVDLSTPAEDITTDSLHPHSYQNLIGQLLDDGSVGPSSENSRQDITDEENYEDFGEVDELESDTSDQNHSHGPNRRVTSAAYASHLQKAGRASPQSDEILDDIDGNFTCLNNKIQFLEKQLTQLTDDRQSNSTVHVKLKEENNVLITNIVDRVHTLEEQLKDMEVKSDERVDSEQRKYKDIMSRQEREKTEQMDYLTQRLQEIEKDYEALKTEVPKWKAEVDKLRMDKLELQDKLNASQEDYNNLFLEKEDLEAQSLRERQTTGQLLDELGKELGDLRKYKIESDHTHRNRTPSMAELPLRYTELQSEVSKLKEENRGLLDMNDELKAQILNKCMEDGKELLRDSEGTSLAIELEHLTKEELMTALREQQEINRRLKMYVDQILLNIMEKNPSLLEVH